MEKKEILQLELQNARNLIEKFEKLQEKFNSKYEDLDIEILDDGDLKISGSYFFDYKNINQLEQVIIDYKNIIKG